VDSTKAEDLTAATIECRKQAYETIQVYRKYVPGMEHCYMVSTPNTVGIRESRRIMGDYILTEDDVKGQREFADNICYGSFFVDIHCIDGPGMDHTVWRPPTGFKYHIPYRVLLPSGIENLLAAGRCVSCTHVALGSIRVMVPCIGMGEAAGNAAALSLETGVTPRQLDVRKLQSHLRADGAILSEADIEQAKNRDAAVEQVNAPEGCPSRS
ncbi:MAG: FAD-dependent oxidoreductase, partial [bacterium]